METTKRDILKRYCDGFVNILKNLCINNYYNDYETMYVELLNNDSNITLLIPSIALMKKIIGEQEINDDTKKMTRDDKMIKLNMLKSKCSSILNILVCIYEESQDDFNNIIQNIQMFKLLLEQRIIIL